MGGEQTLNALETAWRRDPQAVFVRLADAHRKAGNVDKSLSILRDGLSRWPRNLAARVALARLLYELDELEDAQATLYECLDRDPRHWGAVELLATLRRRAGDRRGEVEALERLSKLAPGRRSVERRLAMARRDLLSRPAMALVEPRDEEEAEAVESTSSTRSVRTTSPSRPAHPGRVTTVPSSPTPRAQVTQPSAMPGVPRASRPPEPEDPFFNETMVDLLLAQGRVEEARDMANRLQARRPGRPNVKERLAELSSAAEGSSEASPTELEELMQGVLAAAASELDALSGPIPQPPAGE